MTQAYNLAILANAVDSSGKLNVATNSTGVLPVANGGTGTATPSLVAGSGISISGSFPNQTITNSSTATGTVTSVATGNGLSGGTITTTGTLTVACPTWGSVGSYIWAYTRNLNPNAGSNYSGGAGDANIGPGRGNGNGVCGAIFPDNDGSLSGTWKWMSANAGNNSPKLGLACRVS